MQGLYSLAAQLGDVALLVIVLQHSILPPLIIVPVKLAILHGKYKLMVSKFVIRRATAHLQLIAQQPIIALFRQATQRR